METIKPRLHFSYVAFFGVRRRGGSSVKSGEKWCRRKWKLPNLNSRYWIFIERLKNGINLRKLCSRCLGRHSKSVSVKLNAQYSRHRDISVLSRSHFRFCLLVYITTQRHKPFPDSCVSLCRRTWHKQITLKIFDVHVCWNSYCSFICLFLCPQGKKSASTASIL